MRGAFSEALTTIFPSEIPEVAFLKRYEREGAYTDCYYQDVPGGVSMGEYVFAFYTSPLFKIERGILALVLGKRSTDAEAQALSLGQAAAFAAWRVEAQAAHQLLMCDIWGRTRSWLMVEPRDQDGAASTRLYFGSAVVPTSRSSTGKPSFGLAFHALLGFHRLYTKGLMHGARSRLSRGA